MYKGTQLLDSGCVMICVSRLGYHINAYQTLDGESLVSYQCVVRRDEWELIREPILQAYALQRTRKTSGSKNLHGQLQGCTP